MVGGSGGSTGKRLLSDWNPKVIGNPNTISTNLMASKTGMYTVAVLLSMIMAKKSPFERWRYAFGLGLHPMLHTKSSKNTNGSQ